ncbi:MAG: DMT family transporter [Desulfovibrionaceae bacterium]|nr:DMT family transporter [Desulfovibrionaceae bacterium]MDD4951265.1 DMT family transporter [Desulfovibrionaceae bacterium]
MRALLIVLALSVGTLMPLQAGVNVRLGHVLAGPIQAATVNFGIGFLALLALCLVLGLPLANVGAMGHGPWWLGSGGLLGAFFVAATIFLAERLGAASMMAWLIAGQLAASLVLDHFGLVGYALREASALRVLGALMLVAGAVLVERF